MGAGAVTVVRAERRELASLMLSPLEVDKVAGGEKGGAGFVLIVLFIVVAVFTRLSGVADVTPEDQVA